MKISSNENFMGRKKFFSKKIFVPFFSTFYCGSFEPSYSYVPLPYEACSPNELIAPPADSPAFLESGARTNNDGVIFLTVC